MDPEKQNDTSTNKPAKGYGKRPMWQWVVLYVVVAVVVYFLIYVLFIKDSGGNSLY